MAGRVKISETEVAAPVVAWLQERCWEVYQEVQLTRNGPVADIVATQGRLVWVVECKTSLSLALLDQACTWVGHAHYVSVAVPRLYSRRRGGSAAQLVLCDQGIGCFLVDGNLVIADAPRLFRKPRTEWTDYLSEEHKTYAAAGNCQSRRWTMFTLTCSRLLGAVRNRPGITMKEAVDEIRHHYSSDQCARSSLLTWIKAGTIEGIRIEGGRPLRLYPTDDGK